MKFIARIPRTRRSTSFDVIRSVLAIALVVFIVWQVQLDCPTVSDLKSWIPWLFLTALVTGFCWALSRYRRPYADTARALRKGAEQFETSWSADHGGQGDSDGSASDVGGGDTVRGAWPSALPPRPEAFAGHRPLHKAWTHFHKARCGYGGAARQGRSHVATSDYFTVESVLGKPRESLPDRLPGVFTAIGLLGTFVGIAMGLANISPEQASAAANEELIQGIHTLMGGMSTAFLTSIVGIALSVWWQLDFRKAEYGLESALDRFHAVVALSLPAEEPHETLLRVAGSNESVGRTAEEIKGTAEEIKGNVQSLGQDLADALEPYLEKHIGDPIRNLNTDLGERQTQALARMVEAFRETLVSSVNEQLSELGQALQAASDHQANAAKELEAFFDRLVRVSDAQSKLLAHTAEVATVFDRGLAQLTTATGAIESAGRAARETMSAAREAMETAQRVSQESRRQLAIQKDVTEAARGTWDAQASLLKDLQANLSRLATDLGDKITEFRTASAQKISEVFHVFDSEMAKVVNHLSGTLAELRTVTEELPAAVANLREATQDLAAFGKAERESLERGLRAFEEAKAKVVEQLEQTGADVRNLGRALPELANDFKTRQTELAAAADNLQRGLGAMVEQMVAEGARSEEDRKRLADSIEAAALRISKGADSVVTSIEPIGKRTAEASERLDDLSKRTGALTVAMSKLRVTVNRLSSKTKSYPPKAPRAPVRARPKARAETGRPHVSATRPRTASEKMQTLPLDVADNSPTTKEQPVEPRQAPKQGWRRLLSLWPRG